jgi:hypothetical protein
MPSSALPHSQLNEIHYLLSPFLLYIGIIKNSKKDYFTKFINELCAFAFNTIMYTFNQQKKLWTAINVNIFMIDRCYP